MSESVSRLISYLNDQFPATHGHIPLRAMTDSVEAELAKSNARIAALESQIRLDTETMNKLEKLLREGLENRVVLTSVWYEWRAKVLAQFPELGTK